MAPAPGGADQGGDVIVLLKDGLSGLSLRKAARANRAMSDQAGLVSDIRAHGGSKLLQLISVNAVAGTLSAKEVARLRASPAVKEIIPDVQVEISPKVAVTPHSATAGEVSRNLCPSDPSKPLLEPEALTVDHVASDDPNAIDEANSIATGKGVVVANAGINALAGNPNFKRADGTYVVKDAPSYAASADTSDGEYYGDASSIAAQGIVVYDFHNELPYSGLPIGCTFTIKGFAPDASLVDTTTTTYAPSGDGDPDVESEAQVVAGIDHAVRSEAADIISESYGYSLNPGSYAIHYAANDVAVAAGVTVVVSSGDSGVSGTVSSPASDPNVIAVGATNTLRLNAQAAGYTDWNNNNITPLSSGGTTPNNKLVDLTAPGYGGEAACSQAAKATDCPTNTATEAFGGTSEACPFVAGAAADVIQAYADTHGGTKPTPALIKQILVSTADDISAPADQQGGGQLDVYAAVRAAQQEPGSTLLGSSNDAPAIVSSPSQLDVAGAGGSTVSQSVSLYNASNTASLVSGSYRTLGAQTAIGTTTTEPVGVLSPMPYPQVGATAAQPITFAVPAGLDRLSTDMITPDATNGAILNYELFDPNGKLTQISYDYGTPSTKAGGIGSVPNIQHVEVGKPTAGMWTADIYWGNGRSHLQDPPNTPGSYTGNISFRETGQTYTTVPAITPVTIPANSSATVPLSITMPTAPGDSPQSVQFTASSGATSSLPIARRTLIPATGGSFSTLITSTVGRGAGQVSSYDITIPAGMPSMVVSFTTPDHAADDPFTYYLVNPQNAAGTETVLAQDVDPATTSQQSADAGNAALVIPNPAAGTYEIDVKLTLTVSGQEFTQTVNGTVSFPTSFTASNLPTPGTQIPYGSSQIIPVSITNPTNVGRTFKVTSSGGDISGTAVTTGVYVAAGQTVQSTVLLSPKANGTFNDTLSLVSNVSTTARNLTSQTYGTQMASYTAFGAPAALPDFGTPAAVLLIALVIGSALVMRRRRMV